MANKKIKNILISQPAPTSLENSKYKNIVDKYNVNLTFNKFFDVVSISNKEYRAERINLLDYSAVIMTSTLAVDNYFHFAGVERLKIPDTMKFFCITETVANYLQNYIQYRKRKIFPGKITFDELTEVIMKHSDEKFLLPCAEDARPDNLKKLESLGLDVTKIVMYRSEPKDIRNEIDIKKYDMVVLFSPIGVKSFITNFPTITSNDIIFGAFGDATQAALKKAKIKVAISAPNPKAPSMIMAIEHYLAAAIAEENGEKKPTMPTIKKKETVAKKTVKKATSTTTKAKTATKKTVADKPKKTSTTKKTATATTTKKVTEKKTTKKVAEKPKAKATAKTTTAKKK
ncbi:MAG: uroporphyrinogen-III synthase [Bacteroidales bacterium]|nr:uroporphyrinogen-III synthase [Bacteroidales bacterium]